MDESRPTFGKSLRLKPDIFTDEVRERSPKRVKDRFAQLRELECFPIILAKLRKGEPLTSIAEWIVGGSGEFGKMEVKTSESLRLLLHVFKKTMPPMELIKEDKTVKEATEKLKRGVNEIEELEWAYLVQKERINIDFATEKSINKLFKGTGKEIDIAKNILRTMIVQKMEMGIIQRQMSRIGVEHTVVGEMVTSFGRVSVDKIITDVSSRKKIIGIVERLLSSGTNVENIFEKIKALPIPVDAMGAEEAEVVEEKTDTPVLKEVEPVDTDDPMASDDMDDEETDDAREEREEKEERI